MNQNRAPRKSSTDTRSDDDIGRNLANPKNRGSRQGLYAYMIWDNLREDAGSRFKLYSLDKDLHVILFFFQFINRMAMAGNNSYSRQIKYSL